MRVGILVQSSLWGGLETHAADLARVLQAHGHQVLLVCADRHTADLFRSRIHHSGADFQILALPVGKSWLALVRVLRGLKLDACVFQKGTLHAGSLSLDAVVRLVCRRLIAIQHLAPPPLPPPSTRRVFGVASPNLWRRQMIFRGWLRSIFPHLTVCVSDAVAERLRADYKFSARRIITVRNGVDVERFREDAEARARLRAEWGVSEDRILFGAVCRLVPEKGVDLCLEAFRRIHTNGAFEPVHLVIAGDGPERLRLEQLVREFGIADRVVFTGFRADTPAVLSAIDVLVLSSHLEGLPLTVLEALSIGRPVIATRVYGTPEIFTREGLGWLVEPGDVDALARAMQSAAAASPDQVATMRKAARLHAVERFDASTAYVKVVSALQVQD